MNYYDNWPREWSEYVTQNPRHLEVIPETLYDTQFYHSLETEQLMFFRTNGLSYSVSNMMIGGQLPNPCAFLIESIRIHGISSNIRFGAGMLVIGSKHYGINPAWTYSLKERGFKVKPNLMIPPLVNFEFRLTWQKPESIGIGLSGLPIATIPIQVVMYGQMARAVQ